LIGFLPFAPGLALIVFLCRLVCAWETTSELFLSRFLSTRAFHVCPLAQGRCPTLKATNLDFVAKSWRSKTGEIPIKGITSVDKTALVTLEGVSSLGGVKVAERSVCI